MKRFHSIAFIAILAAPAICLGNPDGPTGSIVLAPKYSFTDLNYSGQSPLSTNWIAGFSLLVPSGRYASFRFNLEAGDVSSRVARPDVDQKVRFEFSFRFYIPITDSAKEKLKNWDERRSEDR